MSKSLYLALRQVFDPTFRKVALKTVAISAALYVGLIAAVAWALAALTLFDIAWIDWILKSVAGAGAIVVAIMLFPLVATMVVGLFLEDIADVVDATHYRDRPAAPGQTIAASVVSAARLVLVALVLNVLALPLYLIPGVNIFVFYGLNGYLLSREYFELVALRRIEPYAARRLRGRSRWRLFFGGVLITFLFSIPVINWLMPIVATAFMVHEFDAIERRSVEI